MSVIGKGVVGLPGDLGGLPLSLTLSDMGFTDGSGIAIAGTSVTLPPLSHTNNINRDPSIKPCILHPIPCIGSINSMPYTLYPELSRTISTATPALPS
jgi:hypothetical protein